MDEKAKAARREYLRAWRAANKDRVKVYNAEYWMRKANKAKQAEFQRKKSMNPALLCGVSQPLCS